MTAQTKTQNLKVGSGNVVHAANILSDAPACQPSKRRGVSKTTLPVNCKRCLAGHMIAGK